MENLWKNQKKMLGIESTKECSWVDWKAEEKGSEPSDMSIDISKTETKRIKKCNRVSKHCETTKNV